MISGLRRPNVAVKSARVKSRSMFSGSGHPGGEVQLRSVHERAIHVPDDAVTGASNMAFAPWAGQRTRAVEGREKHFSANLRLCVSSYGVAGEAASLSGVGREERRRERREKKVPPRLLWRRPVTKAVKRRNDVIIISRKTLCKRIFEKSCENLLRMRAETVHEKYGLSSLTRSQLVRSLCRPCRTALPTDQWITHILQMIQIAKALANCA